MPSSFTSKVCGSKVNRFQRHDRKRPTTKWPDFYCLYCTQLPFLDCIAPTEIRFKVDSLRHREGRPPCRPSFLLPILHRSEIHTSIGSISPCLTLFAPKASRSRGKGR